MKKIFGISLAIIAMTAFSAAAAAKPGGHGIYSGGISDQTFYQQVVAADTDCNRGGGMTKKERVEFAKKLKNGGATFVGNCAKQ